MSTFTWRTDVPLEIDSPPPGSTTITPLMSSPSISLRRRGRPRRRCLLERGQAAPTAEPGSRRGRSAAPRAGLRLDEDEPLVPMPTRAGHYPLAFQLEQVGQDRSGGHRVHRLRRLGRIDLRNDLSRRPPASSDGLEDALFPAGPVSEVVV